MRTPFAVRWAASNSTERRVMVIHWLFEFTVTEVDWSPYSGIVLVGSRAIIRMLKQYGVHSLLEAPVNLWSGVPHPLLSLMLSFGYIWYLRCDDTEGIRLCSCPNVVRVKPSLKFSTSKWKSSRRKLVQVERLREDLTVLFMSHVSIRSNSC